MTDAQSLPALDSSYPLSRQDIESFQTNGHLMLRSLAALEEVSAYRSLITEATTEFAKTYKPMAERDTYGKAFIQYMNLWVGDEKIRRFSLARRFGEVAAALLGVNGVRIYHDQALYKEAGGGHTPWHQDQQYWPLDGVKCVTMWMPLVDASADMGTLNFASGSQALGYLGPMNISDDSDARLKALIKEHGYKVVNSGDMKAGDATFHGGWTIHGAPSNRSQTTTREAMTVIFIDADAVITSPDSEQRANDLAGWFPGLKAGDLAASPLNPIVFQRAHNTV
jgi:ectoine hydroxylase-related dioxygenase (phytanoyl-CoA dioxygenase family)